MLYSKKWLNRAVFRPDNYHNTGEIDFDNVNYINSQRFEESPEIKLQAGDVLLAKDGSTLGIVNVIRYLPKPTTVNSSIAVITPNSMLLGIFLYYLFQSSYLRHVIQSKKGGMGVPHLFQEDINKFKIPMPPYPEQLAIANHLEFIDEATCSLAVKVQETLRILSEYRSALITSAVTGQIDVREEVASDA